MAEQQNIQDIPQDHNQDVPDEATQFQPIPVPDMLGQEPPAYPAQPPPPPPPVDLAAFLQNYLTQQAGQQAQLQQTLELLTQVQHAQLQGQFQQQAQQQIGGSRSLKIKEPRTFTGKREELIPFTSELRNTITLQRGALITDNDKALYMNAFLKKPGPPDSWWNGVSKSHPELLHNFEGLLKNFTEHFEDPDLRATKQRKLDSLEQKGSASNYAARFLELCTYLDLTDATKQDYFKRGLKYQVLQGLAFAIPAPEDLDALVTLVIRIDNNLYALDLQKKKQTSKPKNNTHQRSTSPAPYVSRSTGDASLASVPMEVDAVKHNPLTNSERERRKKNNLCLYCGNAGHKVNDCPELAKKPKKEKIASTSASTSSAGKGKGKPEAQ